MDAVIEWPVAERVRTVLARGASGTVEAGLLRRPLRSARVRDDGVVVLVVDAGGPGHDARGADTEAFPVGSSVSVEVVDTVCTGRCRRTGVRPSFDLGGGAARGGAACGDGCAVARGVVSIAGIITAGSPARRRSALRLHQLRPLEVGYLSAAGAHAVPAAELSASAVDPIGVDEQEWLRRLGADPGLAHRLAAGAGHPAPEPEPRIVGLDRRGLDFEVGPSDAVFRDLVRIGFAQVCRAAEDVRRELAALSV